MPVLILYGGDEHAISLRLNDLQAAYPDATTAGMNVSRLDARGLSEQELNNAVGSLPFLAAERLVILSAPSKRWTGLDGHKKFLAFLETVPPTTKLVLVEAEEIRERERANHWLLKWARKAGAHAEAHDLPRRRDMPGWIVNETRRQGGRIEPAAAARLAEMTGEDTRQAAQEIAKLLTYVNDPGRAVSARDVEQVSIVTASASVFDLVDALGMGDGQQAQAVLQRLLRDEDPPGIFYMVVRQFRLLLLAREALDSGGGQREIEQALGVADFIARKMQSQARHFDLPTLEAIYRRLLEIDLAAKTSQAPLDMSLDMLVVELAQQ